MESAPPPGWAAPINGPESETSGDRPVVVLSEGIALSVPYLGPLPRPSRGVAVLLRLLLAALAGVALYRVMICWQLFTYDPPSGPVDPTATAWIDRAADAFEPLRWVLVGGLLAAIVGLRRWDLARRPLSRRDVGGEAAVETPLVWCVPRWLRVAGPASYVCGLLMLVFIWIPDDASDQEITLQGITQIIASAMPAVTALLLIAWVHFADRAFRSRSALTSPAVREHAAEVPYYIVPWAQQNQRPSATVVVLSSVIGGAFVVLAQFVYYSSSIFAGWAFTALGIGLVLALEAWATARRRRSAEAISLGTSPHNPSPFY